MIALSLLTVSCKNEVKQAEEEKESHEENVVELTEQQLNTIGVKFGHVEQRQLSGTINATGTLRLSPQDRADVTSLVAGITKRILVKEGQAVRQGQTLALVENTEIVALQKDYLVASRQLSLARQALQRQQDIHEQGAGVGKNLQQAKAEFDMASVTEQGLRLQLEQLGISSRQVAQGHFSNAAPVRSPISGVVGEILVSMGSYLDSETVLMKVYDNKALHADLHVFESDIASIHIGQKVTMQLSATSPASTSARRLPCNSPTSPQHYSRALSRLLLQPWTMSRSRLLFTSNSTMPKGQNSCPTCSFRRSSTVTSRPAMPCPTKPL